MRSLETLISPHALADLQAKLATWRETADAVANLSVGSSAGEAHGDAFDTGAFLMASLEQLRSPSGIDPGDASVVRQLQKKVEVFGKLFDRYDRATVRKLGDSSTTVKNYALLAIVLNMLYFREGSLSAFSTATKANDIVVDAGWAYQPGDADLVALSVLLEAQAIARSLGDEAR